MAYPLQFVTTPLPEAIAVLDGSLCHLTREGTRARAHAPLATAVVEFHRGPFRSFVREHPHGLLPGLPNLYCLDGSLRLQWMAEWPDPADPCASIVGEEGDTLVALSVGGTRVRLDIATGRLLSCESPMAATGS